MSENELTSTGDVAGIFATMNSIARVKAQFARHFVILTEREKEVMALLAQGYNNPEVARSLRISRTTIQNHRAAIRRKLRIRSDAEMFQLAMAFGLVGMS